MNDDTEIDDIKIQYKQKILGKRPSNTHDTTEYKPSKNR